MSISVWFAAIVLAACGTCWWIGRQSRSHMDALMIRHLQREVRRLREERRFAVGTTRSGKSTMVPRQFYDQDRQQVWLFEPDKAPRALRDKDGEA
jgi:hypothetical protein